MAPTVFRGTLLKVLRKISQQWQSGGKALPILHAPRGACEKRMGKLGRTGRQAVGQGIGKAADSGVVPNNNHVWCRVKHSPWQPATFHSLPPETRGFLMASWLD